jgi:hypothetical protein
MGKILFLALGIFGVSVSPVRAQELPAGDLSVGYSYLREGFNNGVNANGGGAALAGYVNRWLGITGDFGAYHAAPFGIVGGAHVTAGASGVSGSTSGFAWSAGGGIDLGLGHHMAFRPPFDYLGIHAGGGTLNSARVSAGIVFRFGSR